MSNSSLPVDYNYEAIVIVLVVTSLCLVLLGFIASWLIAGCWSRYRSRWLEEALEEAEQSRQRLLPGYQEPAEDPGPSQHENWALRCLRRLRQQLAHLAATPRPADTSPPPATTTTSAEVHSSEADPLLQPRRRKKQKKSPAESRLRLDDIQEKEGFTEKVQKGIRRGQDAAEFSRLSEERRAQVLRPEPAMSLSYLLSKEEEAEDDYRRQRVAAVTALQHRPQRDPVDGTNMPMTTVATSDETVTGNDSWC